MDLKIETSSSQRPFTNLLYDFLFSPVYNPWHFREFTTPLFNHSARDVKILVLE